MAEAPRRAKRQKTTPAAPQYDQKNPDSTLTDLEKDAVIPSLNADHHAEVETAINRVLDTFAGIQTAEPLDINTDADTATRTASLHAFNQEACAALLETKETYGPVGINMWWIDARWSAHQGVPINVRGVKHTKEHLYLTPPKTIEEPFIIGVLPDDNVLEMKGRLKRVSPDETHHALLIAISDAAARGADEDELAAWRATMLSVPAIFVRLKKKEDFWWKAACLRQSAAVTLTAVIRTPLAQCIE
eukprot:12315054-Alexandrium_andersonii.AAC.1